MSEPHGGSGLPTRLLDVRPRCCCSALAHAGIEVGPFLQINLTETVPGAIRGLHSQYVYCFDAEWAPVMPGAAVNPLDPELGICWPVQPDPSLVSVKDRSLPSLQTVLRRARAG